MLVLFLLSGSSGRAGPRSAENGVIDLAGWNIQEDLKLDGEWHFFWNELLEPHEALNRISDSQYRPKMARVGERFKSLDSQITTDMGYATYILKLKNLPSQQLAMAAVSAYTSSKVYFFAAGDAIAAKPIVMLGEVGESASTSYPVPTMQGLRPLLPREAQDHYFLIQVTNFYHPWGGLWIPPRLAAFDKIQALVLSRVKFDYLIIGIFLLVGFYNLGFYWRRREDRGSLFLAIFVFDVTLRTWLVADWSNLTIADIRLDYEIKYKIFHSCLPISSILFLYFLRTCFPRQTPVWLLKISWAVNGVPLLFIFSTTIIQYGEWASIFKVSGIAICIVILVCVIRAAIAREEGAFYSLFGLFFVVLGAVNDILYSLGYNEFVPNATSWGLLVFIACQSQIIAVRFASAFRNSERLSGELSREVERQTRDIRSILKSIRQGIFTLLPNKKIGNQYSEHLKQMIGCEDIHGQTLQSLILDQSHLSGDQKSQIEAALDASLGEDRLAFEMNEACFVREIQYQSGDSSQLLEVDWNPICNKANIVEEILVSLRDVTEVRSLQKQAEQREEDMKIIVELIQIPEEKFHRFINKTRKFLQENRDLILGNSNSKSDVIKRLFMNMHTIKGAARTYFLQAISNASHEVEQYYSSLQRLETPWNQGRLLDDIDRVEGVIDYYQKVGKNRLGWNLPNRVIKLDKTRIESSLSQLQSIDLQTVDPEVRQRLMSAQIQLIRLCYDDLPALVEEVSRGLDSIARDLMKEVPLIQVGESNVIFKEKGAELLYNMLVHLLRNSMDHGIETPELRLSRGKEARGRIMIEPELVDGCLRITYRDDGNGLDLAALRDKGLDCDLLEVGRQYSDFEIASLIFQSGFSTKNSVSEISGRGVGLDAVRTYAAADGATVELNVLAEVGHQRVAFEIHIKFPSRLFWKLDHESLQQDLTHKEDESKGGVRSA